MSNSLVTIDMVTREALRIAHESAAFISTTDLQYDDSFAKTGAKIGTALRVRKPNQYTRTQGSRVMDVQDQAEATGTITVATQDHVDMRFNSAELSLSIDEISKRYIEPAVKVLVSGIESDYLAASTKATYNTAGAAGTAITTLLVPGDARAKLNQGLAPKDQNRSVQMGSTTMSTLVNGVAAYFNPSGAISSQYKEGLVARTGMADFYENERIWTMTNGDDVAGEIDESAETNFVQGATLVHMDGLGTASTLAVGSVFTWEGLYACHPETKARYPHLQQFTVTAIANPSSNDVDVSFSPAIYTTGPKKNVVTSAGAEATWTSTGQDGKDITLIGNASASYPTALMYHKEAFQFVTADLPLMDDAHKCVRRTQDGLSLRVWQASDIRNDELLMRIDILYGFAALRPEWACRMIGAVGA
jgi:hypothetical protein